MVKTNGKNGEHLTVLNVPHLRKKIKKTCANRPVSCVNGEVRTDFGSPKGRGFCIPQNLPSLSKALPLGELSPKVTERARMLARMCRRSDSIALPKSQLIAAWRLSGDGLALSVIACAMPPLPRGEAFASRKACPLCPRLPLWGSWRGAPERARTLTARLLLFRGRHGILGKEKPADWAGKRRMVS